MSFACSSGQECVELPSDCTPLYAVRYEELFARTLQPTCGQAGAYCHASEGAKAGLVFADIDQAYGLLTDPDRSGGPLVIAHDPECSPLVHRLESEDPSFSMPPGSSLSAEERCVVQHWIRAGAQR